MGFLELNHPPPVGNELLDCCNYGTVKTITSSELRWDTGGKEYSGRDKSWMLERFGGNKYYKDNGICMGIARSH